MVAGPPYPGDDMQDEDAFWMVWNPGRDQPTHRHETRDAAMQEARRLARLNPGERFYVLAAESVAMKIDVDVRELIHRIPF